MPVRSGVKASPPASPKQLLGLRTVLCDAFDEECVIDREGGFGVKVGYGTVWSVGFNTADSHPGGVKAYVRMLRSVADSVETMEGSLMGDLA